MRIRNACLMCICPLALWAWQEQGWDRNMTEGIRLVGEGRYRQAEEALAAAWREAQSFPQGDPRIALTSNNLGVLFDKMGRSDDAEKHYKRALRLLESAGPDRFREIAGCLNNLAVLYLERNQVDRAERMCRRLSAYSPDQLGDDLYFRLEQNLAAIHFKRGEREHAEQRFRNVLSLLEKRSGPLDANAALVLIHLGALAGGNRRTAEARSSIQRALRIYEQLHGPLHPDLVPPLTILAAVDMAEGNPIAAETSYRRALAILEIAHGPDSILAAPVLDNLAVVLGKLNQKSEAKQLNKRARAIRADHTQANPDRHIVALDDLLRRRSR